MKLQFIKYYFWGLIIFLFANLGSSAADNPFTSKVYYWDKAESTQTSSGIKREFVQTPTNNLDYISVEAITINPKQILGLDIDRSDFETLIIVKDGEIKHTINNESRMVGPGSVILAYANDNFVIENIGRTPATYYLIQWKTVGNKSNLLTTGDVEVLDWNNVKFTETEKGGTRNFIRKPTPSLIEFEMHVTTLKEGIKSHDPHTHPADEIILVKSGTVEELVDGKPYQMGVGSFILLNGNEPHGIRNIGKGTCEYFAFRFLNIE